jgi:hypothetical protein
LAVEINDILFLKFYVSPFYQLLATPPDLISLPCLHCAPSYMVSANDYLEKGNVFSSQYVAKKPVFAREIITSGQRSEGISCPPA